jgi:aconitate hydratase
VLAKSFARIHFQNLINFGILPLTFLDRNDYAKIGMNDVLEMDDIRNVVVRGNTVKVFNKTKNETYLMNHSLSQRQIDVLLAGGIINLLIK